MDIDNEERRLAIEIIATLAHIKTNLVEHILKPADIPVEVYRPLLYKRDDGSGKKMSKRQIAPLIIDALESKGKASSIRKLVQNAANWDKFYIAHDEYAARATVQKAQAVWKQLNCIEHETEKRIKEATAVKAVSEEQERSKALNLLLAMFDDMTSSNDHHKRGYLLQDLMMRLFLIFEIPVLKAFTRNQGGEQIDGAFRLDGWHYIVECRWRDKLADIRELDGLKGQVDRSGKQTMGIYMSINGWSTNVVPLLKQNPEKAIILMEGYDLRTILAGQVSLIDLFQAKVAKLNLEAEPYYSVRDYLLLNNDF